ncbi:unnamed protein product, partial [Didymodactylos carnosus]
NVDINIGVSLKALDLNILAQISDDDPNLEVLVCATVSETIINIKHYPALSSTRGGTLSLLSRVIQIL